MVRTVVTNCQIFAQNRSVKYARAFYMHSEIWGSEGNHKGTISEHTKIVLFIHAGVGSKL